MNVGDIAFPHLGVYLKDVPKSFSIFGFDIAFYGLIIGIGVLAGILLAAHMAKVTGQNSDDYWDFAIYAVIFSIIGARIYYVVFSWDYYKDDLLGIFKLRNGGMAIYGAVIAAFITLFVYGRIKKKNPFLMGDSCMRCGFLWKLCGPGIFRRTSEPIFRRGQITSVCTLLFCMRVHGIFWCLPDCFVSGSTSGSTESFACCIWEVMGWEGSSLKASVQIPCSYRAHRCRCPRSWPS